MSARAFILSAAAALALGTAAGPAWADWHGDRGWHGREWHRGDFHPGFYQPWVYAPPPAIAYAPPPPAYYPPPPPVYYAPPEAYFGLVVP